MTTQLCTFRLGEMWLGVEVSNVQEIIRFQELTSVPLTTNSLQGLINLRGQIVTVVDLRHRLGVEDDAALEEPTNVVLRTEDGAVSIPVDAIGDVLDVDNRRYEEPPETMTGDARELIAGVYKLEGHLLMMLDVEKTVCCEMADLTGAEYVPSARR